MELRTEATIPIPVEEAWPLLLDLERIAPCMPGAQLQEVEGEEYRGVVKVKVGPITAEYKGAASIVERDEAGRRAVLRAEGRETRGQGNAKATVTASLSPSSGGTKLTVVADLTVTGRVAQFGRGVMADVSNKLMQEFVDCLRTDVLGGGNPRRTPSGDGARAGDRTSEGVRRIEQPEPRPVDLVRTAGAPVLKRLAPFAAVLVVLWLAFRRRRRRG